VPLFAVIFVLFVFIGVFIIVKIVNVSGGNLKLNDRVAKLQACIWDVTGSNLGRCIGYTD